jgi:dethiobiotin synthetase
MRRIIFITGTGTGAGKTVLTALLLAHLREPGCRALALKLFCSGSRADARLLQRLQHPALTLEETNPFFFRHPLAPWVAARAAGRAQITFSRALQVVKNLSRRTETLLVEGSGGILVPLGDDYTLADLAAKLSPRILVAGVNGLGIINHACLTVKQLQTVGIKEVVIVLMSPAKPDLSSKTNVGVIRRLLPGVPVFMLPYLGEKASNVANVKQSAKYLKKTLAQVLEGDRVCLVPSNGRRVDQQNPLTIRR